MAHLPRPSLASDRNAISRPHADRFKKPYQRPKNPERQPKPSVSRNNDSQTLSLDDALGVSSSIQENASTLTDAQSSTRKAPPPSALFSDKVSNTTRHIIKTLKNASNPITHNPESCMRAQHFVSTSTGHQQSEGGHRSTGENQGWMKTRMAKLKEQSQDVETSILKGVTAWINGYSGDEITNRMLTEMIQRAGGQTRPVLSMNKCTHIITSMGLCASKTEKEIRRRRGGCVIVNPQWVLDSVRDGRRLPEWNYPVIQNENQNRISAMFQNHQPNKP